MAINYSVVAMKNPSQPDGPQKYYAKAQASGVIDINELAEDISYATSLTDGDVLNAIRAPIKQMCKHIEAGRIVRLENFGSFQAQVRSKGTESSELFTPSNIQKVHIQFRPGKGIKGTLEIGNLNFRRVKTKKEGKAETGTDEGDSL